MNKIKSFFKKSFTFVDNGLTRFTKNDSVQTVISSICCALIGLIIGFLILLCINPMNSFEGMASTLKNFFIFSSSSKRLYYFGSTLAKTAPLIMISMSILFGYKCGLFNIGASGQYTMALVVILFAGLHGNMPWYVVIILGMLAGAIYSALTGLLKAFFNVSEVISGIMLNWIALYFCNGILQTSNIIWDYSKSETFKILPGSNAFLPNIGLDYIFGGNSIVGLGLIIAIIVVIVIFVVLKKTTFGFEIQAIGLNKDAATYAGMSKTKNIIISTAICGALSGLAASLNFQNGFGSYSISSTVISIGFDGISAAFLGGLNPIGVIFSSYFITHITEGGSSITDLGYAPQVVDIMTASIIYLSGFVSFIKQFISEKDLIKEQRRLTRENSGKEIK